MGKLKVLIALAPLCLTALLWSQEKKETLLYGAKVFPDEPVEIPYPFRSSLVLEKKTLALLSVEEEGAVILEEGTKVKVLYPLATRGGGWFYYVETEEGTRLYIPVKELY